MFDPYHKWLGILPKDQPPNHYRLLGVEVFESDLDVIEGAAERQMTFIRQYQSGEHALAAAKILNELAKARLCLLKPDSKANYDAELRAALAPVADEAPTLPFLTEDAGAISGPYSLVSKAKKRSRLPIIAGGLCFAFGVAAMVLFSDSFKPPVAKHVITPIVSASTPSTDATTQTAARTESAESDRRPNEPQSRPNSGATKTDMGSGLLDEMAANEPEPQDAPKMKDQAEALANVSPVTTDSMPSMPPSTSSGLQGEWIDLLEWAEGVDWSQRGINWNDNIVGKPTRRGIQMKQARHMRFPLPAIMDGDYQMEVEFKRFIGAEAVAIYFPVGIHTMRLLLGAEAGELAEVSFVDGKAYGTQKPARIANDVVQRVAIRVSQSNDLASFSIDWNETQDFIKWQGTLTSLANHDTSPWSTTMIQRPWIGAWECDVTFQKIRVRMLTGTIRRDCITEQDREQDLKNGLVRLAGEKATGVSVGTWRFTVNQFPPVLQGIGTERRWPMISREFKICDNFYGAHAPSRLKIPIPSGAKSFTVIGYNDASRSARFQVIVDAVQIYESGETGMCIIKVDIPPKSGMLELSVVPGADNSFDHTYWCYPRFHSVMSERVTDKMLDDKRTTLKFAISSHTTALKLTYDRPIGACKSIPIHFRYFLPCDEFFVAHAPSTLTFQVPSGMTRFTATGYNVLSHSVKYEVWADAKRIYESPQAGIIPIETKLPPGTKTIELKTLNLGDTAWDQSLWCYPRLHRK